MIKSRHCRSWSRLPLLWQCQLATAGVCLLFAGCGGQQEASVSGEVTFQGEPLEDGIVLFLPSEETPGHRVAGEVKGGKYAVSSEKGLGAGTYSVSITAWKETGRKTRNPEPMPGEPAEIAETIQYIPAEYNTQSKLQAQIEAGENKKDFEIP